MAKKTLQTVTATQEWRQRMASTRRSLPDAIGQQDVIIWVVTEKPDLDRLTNATRWRNAWLGRVADPEITQLVEKAAVHFNAEAKDTSNRLKRQKLKKVL